MRTFVSVATAVFGLLFLTHMWRAIQEGVHAFGDPWFALTTLSAALLVGWGLRLLIAPRTSGPH